MMIFHQNLRKFAEIFKHFIAKIMKICPKKMYTLNRYGGKSAMTLGAGHVRRAASPRIPGFKIVPAGGVLISNITIIFFHSGIILF